MKTTHPAAPLAAILVAALATSLSCLAQGNGNGNGNNNQLPRMPFGWIDAFPTIVQTGTKPTLTWGINYPSVVLDYVTIQPPATCIPKEDMDCEIRVLGAGVTVHTSGSTGFTFVPTEALVSYDGSSYERIFYGTNLSVNQNTVRWSRSVKKNRNIRFGGRYFYNNSWGPLRTSTSGTQNVRTLVNGDIPPTTYPLHSAPTLEEFIRPYLDPQGRVKIGPLDVIVFMELTHSDSQVNDPGYDLQDMVLLVTFKPKARTNNGHGNNIDGIDSSNPGNAPFINLDTDPNVDDEGGGGGAYPSQP